MERSYSIRDRARVALVMLVFAMAASSASAEAAGVDRYVNAVGGIDSGSCSVPASPCLSIAYAITQTANDDTIHIAAGTYVDPLTITKQGLKLVGQNPANKPVITRYSGLANQALLVIIGVKNVEVRDLEFRMDQTFVAEGILASGFVDGLKLSGNDFNYSRSGANTSTYGYRNAISINDTQNSRGLGRADGSLVTIDGNTINGVDLINGVLLRIGIDIDGSVAHVTNNTIAAGVHDVRVRFPTTTPSSSAFNTLVDGNTLNGRGLELAVPNASSGPITISNNQLNAIGGIDDSTNYPADYSIMRLIGNSQSVALAVSGNIFAGYQGKYRGVLIQNFPGANFTGNTFSPAPGASDFVSLVIGNKELNSGTAAAPLAMSITAMGNHFNGSGVAGAGRAVEFFDDNDAGGAASFGSLLFGGAGPGEANQFDVNLRWYFRLDNHNCNTVNAPTCSFLDYAGAIGNAAATNTQVRPFTGNVSASQNLFDGALPAAMTPAQKSGLLGHTFDKMADAQLGIVDYGITATKPVVYVDDNYAGRSYGDPLVFSHGAVTPGTVYFGINAFATIPVGVANVDVGGPVYVAKGNYNDSLTLTKHVQLIGDGSSGVDTVIGNAVIINAGGASHAAPLLMKNLRVTNAAGNAVRVNTASYLAFDHVEFSGNGSSGLDFAAVSDDIVIVGSAFDGNVGHGIRTASTAQVSHVAIDNSTFSNNSTGILLFGSGNTGNGQISNWTITDSQFLSNENTNLNVFGGGIWIKTAGPGSVIDGVSVTGSTFADNGSANTLNRVGITVRARSGTTMQKVSICNNTFIDNAGTLGTQLTGINVVDDSANAAYQPITVCASNTFTGLGHSVSGLEQFNLYGTQPAVIITGGSITNTEYINGLVVRVRDGAKFASIGAGMNDVDTTTGDELHAPAGLYAETVTFTHDNMTLSGDGAATIIDGGNGNQPGITLPNGRIGSTITDLTVRNVHNSCIHGSLGNSGTTVRNTLLSACRADIGGFNGGGAYMNGPVDDVTFDNNEVTASAARGLVIWNGYKSNIRFTNNHVHDMVGCCGIELQDGTASAVTATGNTIENVGDSGMAFIGLGAGAGANLISNNTIINTGRYGIEIKIPNGTGALSGDGSIVVSNNMVTRPAMPTSLDQRDVSGIAVIRRGYSPTSGETDITSGVIVTGNTVSGWVPANGSPNDGFGIVAEGIKSRVFGNTLSGNQIGVQLQAGNDGYPGDSNQNLTNDFFSRGNSPSTCIDLGSNSFSGNAIDNRSVSLPAGQNLAMSVHNTTRGTSFCSIQAAINDAATLNGDVITVAAGAYGENIVISKGLTLQGPFAGTAGHDGSRSGSGEAVISPASGRAVRVNADNVVFDGFTIANVADTAISSGGNYGGSSTHVQIANNRVIDVHSGSGIYTNGDIVSGRVYDWTVSNNLFRNIDSAIGSGVNLWKATGGTISGNHIENSGHGGIQLNNSNTISITANIITNTAGNGVNVAESQSIIVAGNLITDANTSNDSDSAGLTLYGGSSNVDMLCNTVNGGGNNGFSTSAGIPDPFSAIRVFDNALLVTSSVSHNLAQAINIGSNWYGGSPASIAGTNAAGAQIADPLSATPIGSAICTAPNPATANAATAILAYAGTPQSTLVNTAFASTLDARVVDALGGAVMGESVSFAAPASGATATLGPVSGLTNFNGVVSISATANNLAGSYAVTANSGSLTPEASFALTNNPIIGTVSWDSLSFVYDGNTHLATAHITEEPATTCTVTPAVGPDVGNYAVTASCNGTTYAASGTNTASITPASATLALSNLTQTFDGSPKPATVTSTPPGVSFSVTYNGNPTAPSAIGDYAVVATITDPNYTGPQASNVLHIVQADAPDLGISITDNRHFVQFGKLLTYTIVVNNPGNTNMTGATVTSNLPVTLLNATPSWQCVQVSRARAVPRAEPATSATRRSTSRPAVAWSTCSMPGSRTMRVCRPT
ncbi:MAG: right-handed parallel beta-helix repeat-containing protein [Xanthomonadales bacterium]|nr:right-handed parallel beta-helix repeat-containing protein [Xanthomonadales bacterium]